MRNTRANLKLIDDIAKMATGALGNLGDVREQVRRHVKERVEQVLERMDLVTREEFERVEALAEKARDRQDERDARQNALEGKSAPRKTAKKTAKKSTKTNTVKRRKK